MPRPQRIEFNGAYYFVENTGLKGKKIFADDDDKDVFLGLLADVAQTFSIDILAYALLDDHYQVLLRTPKAGLSRAMRHLDGVFTQRFNDTHASHGHVFKDRYRAIVIDPKTYLGETVAAIHARPVYLDYCALAADYPWSSHEAFNNVKVKPEWLNTDLVLKQLGFLRALASAKLNTLVRKSDGRSFENLLKSHPQVLGSSKFESDVLELADNNSSQDFVRETHHEKTTTAKNILDFVSFAYNVPVPEIKKSVSGVANEARNMAAYQLRTVGGMAQKEIARVLNCASPYTVAKSLERFNTKLNDNETLKFMAQRITRDINSRLPRQ